MQIKLEPQDKEQINLLSEKLQNQTIKLPPLECTVHVPSIMVPLRFYSTYMTEWTSKGEFTEATASLVLNQPLRIWKLPDSFGDWTTDTDRVHPSVKPAIKPWRGKADRDTGNLIPVEIKEYAWATRLRVRVKQLPAIEGNPSSQWVYELAGAHEADILLLERLLNNVGDWKDSSILVKLLYAAEKGSVIESGSHGVQLSMTKVNLSTVTNPPIAAVADTPLTSQASNGLQQMGVDEFVRMLWEGSITRSGGFYLNYYDPDVEEKGLPKHLFREQNEATIELLLLFRDRSMPMQSYVNCLVTGEADRSSEGTDNGLPVYAEVERNNATPMMLVNQTLAEFAQQYFSDVMEIAENNAEVLLQPGITVTIRGGITKIGDPGINNIKDMMNTFGTVIERLEAENPQIKDFDQLAPLQPVKLGDVQRTTLNEYSLKYLSDLYGVPVSSIAADNADIKQLYPSTQELKVITGPILRVPVLQPGMIELRAERNQPPEESDSEFQPEPYMQSLFHMLSYEITENDDFDGRKPLAPLGPRDQPTAEPDSTKPWLFTKTIPYTGFVKDHTEGLKSPYRGIGSILQIHVNWMDVFGNKLFSVQDADHALRRDDNKPILIGYTDALLGPGQWPSVALCYRIVKRSPKEAAIQFVFEFDSEAYHPSVPEKPRKSVEAIKKKIKADLTVFQRLMHQINHRIKQGNNQNIVALDAVTFSWRSSLLNLGQEESLSLGKGNVGNIKGWIGTIVEFLSTGNNKAVKSLVLEETIKINELNLSHLFELKTEFIMNRPMAYVSADFRSVRSVWESRSLISPYSSAVNKTDNDNGNEPVPGKEVVSLRPFALQLEEALSIDGRYMFKTAVGLNRASKNSSAAGQSLWLVAIALSTQLGIQCKIKNQGKPAIYAPIPLTNKLEPRVSADSWSFEDIEGFKLNENSGFTTDSGRMDQDAWAFVQLMDRLLTPEFIAPCNILKQIKGTNYVETLVQLKRRLAAAIVDQVAFVYQSSEPQPGLASAKEAYRQSLLNKLSHAFNTDVIVQFTAEVQANLPENKEDVYPQQLYGSIISGQDAILPPGLFWNHPKLSLGTNGQSQSWINMLLTGNHQEDLAELAVQSSLKVDAGYLATHIEHQVGELFPGDPYKASSWLQFILPPKAEEPQSWPLYLPLGTFEVPLVLKDIPEMPRLIKQSCDDPLKGVKPPNALSEFLHWDYTFFYSMSKHHPQDRVYFIMRFQDELLPEESAQKKLDLCAELAQLQQYSGAIQQALELHVRPLVHGSKDEDMQHAERTMSAVTEITKRITESWEQRAAAPAPVLQARSGIDIPDYIFYVEEQEDDLGEHIIRLTEVARTDFQDFKPEVQLEGYVTRTRTFQEKECSNGTLQDRTVYEYRFDKVKIPEDSLAKQSGLSIPERKICIRNLSIIELQKVHLSSYVTRNEELVPEQCTAEAFVYRTETTPMAEPLSPYLFRDEPIRMVNISGEGRSLFEHLSSFFKTLFRGEYTSNEQMVILECKYVYDLPNEVGVIQIPILLAPTTDLDITRDFDLDVSNPWITGNLVQGDPFIYNLASAIWNFFGENVPYERKGRIVFDLKVLSVKSARKAPLLQLSNIYLDIQSMQPRPPALD